MQNKIVQLRCGGFTLVELMIVVAIIGVLAAVGLPQFLRFSMKSKRAEALTVLKAAYGAQIVFFASNNQFAYGTNGVDATAINKDLGLDILPSSMKYYSSFSYDVKLTPAAFVAILQGDIDGNSADVDWLFIRSEEYNSACAACSGLYKNKSAAIAQLFRDDIFNIIYFP